MADIAALDALARSLRAGLAEQRRRRRRRPVHRRRRLPLAALGYGRAQRADGREAIVEAWLDEPDDPATWTLECEPLAVERLPGNRSLRDSLHRHRRRTIGPDLLQPLARRAGRRRSLSRLRRVLHGGSGPIARRLATASGVGAAAHPAREPATRTGRRGRSRPSRPVWPARPRRASPRRSRRRRR